MSPKEAAVQVKSGEAMPINVREEKERQRESAQGTVHASRGLLEQRLEDLAASAVTPLALHSHSVSRYLEIEWEDGAVSRLPHRLLRLRCRCAECLQAARSGRGPNAPENLSLTAVLPYGPASVQLRFSDGHERGIFPFPYLRELAAEAVLSTELNLS